MRNPSLFGVATLIELLVPLIAILIFWRLPNLRRRVVVLLGAVTPFLLAYGAICGFHLFRDTTNPHADRPLEIAIGLSFFPYFSTICAGIALAFLWKTGGLAERYLIGFFAAPFIGVSLLALFSAIMLAV